MTKPRHWLPALLVATVLFGCTRDKEKSKSESEQQAPGVPAQTEEELNQPLAVIDDVVITVGEFQERINRQSPYIRSRYASMEQKREFLDNLIRFEVLAKEGKRRGLDKNPDVVRTMKQVMIQKLMKDEFENRIKPEDITDDEMRAFYEANKSDYSKPEEVRVAAIIVKRKADADKVATLALGEEGKSNKGFRDLVNQHSKDETTRLRGGDLRYFARDTEEVPKPVVDAAFALQKTGDVAGPIAAGDGRFFIIKQTGRRRAIDKDFEQVKRQIQNRLYRDKRTQEQKDFITNLKKKAKIEVNDANLSKVRVDTSAAHGGSGDGHGTAPAFPGDEPAPDLPDDLLPGGDPAPEPGGEPAGDSTASPDDTTNP